MARKKKGEESIPSSHKNKSQKRKQISKEKRLFLFPFGILFLGFLILFFSNNETSGKDVEFFHRAKR